MKKTIEIGQGVGSIKFGMTRDAVKAILGEPQDVDSYEFSELDAAKTEAWHYYALGLSLSFDQEENWRLVTLSVSSNDYTLNQEHLIGMTRDEIVTLIKEWEMGEMEEEDMSTSDLENHILIGVDAVSTNFWFEEGQLSELQWGPLWKDEETLDFPV